MTIVAPESYRDNLSTLGYIPGGPRGSAVGAGAGIAGRLAYRGAKWVVRRFFKPNQYTYRGAVGRGIGIGTGIVALLNPEVDDLDGQIPTGNGQTPNRFQQRNRRRSPANRSRRCNIRHRHRNCC